MEQAWGGFEGSFSDCHRVSNRDLNISTDEAFTTSSGNLAQYGTTRTHVGGDGFYTAVGEF